MGIIETITKNNGDWGDNNVDYLGVVVGKCNQVNVSEVSKFVTYVATTMMTNNDNS